MKASSTIYNPIIISQPCIRQGSFWPERQWVRRQQWRRPCVGRLTSGQCETSTLLIMMIMMMMIMMIFKATNVLIIQLMDSLWTTIPCNWVNHYHYDHVYCTRYICTCTIHYNIVILKKKEIARSPPLQLSKIYWVNLFTLLLLKWTYDLRQKMWKNQLHARDFV